MRFRYGAYEFDANAVSVQQEQETLWNAGGQPYAHRRTFRLEGYLTASGQSAVTAAMVALQNALAIPYRDLVLLQDNGQESATILKNAGSITGVQPKLGPSYPESIGFEYSGGRHFTATFEAEYPLAGTNNLLLDFTEEVEFWGGGPLRGAFPCTNGPPQEQILWPQVPFEAIQRGVATGYLAYPPALSPIWPAKLEVAPRYSRRSPKRRGNGYQEFPVQYQYKFISATPLIGVPNRWLG